MDSSSHGAARRVVLVVFDGCALLDMAGPADVFRAATRLGASRPYEVVLASPDGASVRAECGVLLSVDMSLREVLRSHRFDTLLIAGGDAVRALVSDPDRVDELRRLAARARRITSVCTGALALAAAGLLDGRRATTHWAQCDRMQRTYPQVRVEADRIYVRDGNRWTSAGVTAGIDLALALVEDDNGAQLAHGVATALVVFVRRPGGQAQFSAQMRAQPARTPALIELQRWLPDNLDADTAVATLAQRAGMSPRTFARQFRLETGSTPAVFVEELRVEAAKRLLAGSELTVAGIAARVGFTRPETMHRAFSRRAGTTPQRYRDHFSDGAGARQPVGV